MGSADASLSMWALFHWKGCSFRMNFCMNWLVPVSSCWYRLVVDRWLAHCRSVCAVGVENGRGPGSAGVIGLRVVFFGANCTHIPGIVGVAKLLGS